VETLPTTIPVISPTSLQRTVAHRDVSLGPSLLLQRGYVCFGPHYNEVLCFFIFRLSVTDVGIFVKTIYSNFMDD